MHDILVWWIGAQAADEAAMEVLRQRVEDVFEWPATCWHDERRPTGTYDAGRGQHLSTAMLRWLNSHRPHDAARVVGVTDVDLFIPILTFVYGEAQLGGHCAVVSSARLGSLTLPMQRQLTLGRLVKEAVHELGHTFGLVHCRDGECVMSRSPSLASVDAKHGTLCGDCRLIYLEKAASLGTPYE
ncbi:MAG: archaemetzincin [Vicinamibacteraceae bacterium]|nr:archaemetzincin [Vicinamibacteraceae bacterium]